LLLSNELDRTLKKQFGVAFFAATMFFTMLSFGVIVFNGIYHWGISDTAVTALIVETPIQFIGLLYIIARNLFPQTGRTHQAMVTMAPSGKSTPAKRHPMPAAPKAALTREPDVSG
jgi:hypothetical protein